MTPMLLLAIAIRDGVGEAGGVGCACSGREAGRRES